MSLFDFDNLSSSREYSQSKSDVAKNRPKFCMFLALNIFRGATPNFLEFCASFERDSDNVAKFRGDRPRDLGDVAS